MKNKNNMNDDIKKYPIFRLSSNGNLIKITNIHTANDYNHFFYNLHHFIPKSNYEKNKKWYEEHNIEQKLILLPIEVHEQLHFQAVNLLSDDDFEVFYKISRWELVFNKRYSSY